VTEVLRAGWTGVCMVSTPPLPCPTLANQPNPG
jgi:hypothetical protein